MNFDIKYSFPVSLSSPEQKIKSLIEIFKGPIIYTNILKIRLLIDLGIQEAIYKKYEI